MVKTSVSEDEIRDSVNTELPNRKLLRVDEVAQFFSVSERTIRLWVDHGLLRAGKMRGTTRIFRESVEAWYEQFRNKEPPES